MGNRVNLIFTDENKSLYAHWNGGPESYVAVVAYAMEHMGARKGALAAPVAEIYQRAFNSNERLQDGESSICANGDNGDVRISWCEESGLPFFHKPVGASEFHCLKHGGFWSMVKRLQTDEYWKDPSSSIFAHIARSTMVDRHLEHCVHHMVKANSPAHDCPEGAS